MSAKHDTRAPDAEQPTGIDSEHVTTMLAALGFDGVPDGDRAEIAARVAALVAEARSLEALDLDAIEPWTIDTFLRIHGS